MLALFWLFEIVKIVGQLVTGRPARGYVVSWAPPSWKMAAVSGLFFLFGVCKSRNCAVDFFGSISLHRPKAMSQLPPPFTIFPFAGFSQVKVNFSYDKNKLEFIDGLGYATR